MARLCNTRSGKIRYNNNPRYSRSFRGRRFYSTREYRGEIHFCVCHTPVSLLSAVSSPITRRATRPLLTSKRSAKPCFQRYFAAVGVIFQQGRIGRIFPARFREGQRARKRRDVLCAHPRRGPRVH